MAVSDAFRDYVLEQLSRVGEVTPRRMFGGVGLYHDARFFAVMDNDELYFKVDDASRPKYEKAGSGPFDPMPDHGAMRGYYEVPADVLEDRDELAAWAREAVAIAAKPKGKKAMKAKKAKMVKKVNKVKKVKAAGPRNSGVVDDAAGRARASARARRSR